MNFLRAYLGLAAIAAGSLSAGLLVRVLWPDDIWMNEPFHAVMEAVGAVVSVAMAFVLFERRHEREDGQARRLALGFLGMGLLELFHAFSPPDDAFVLLRTTASVVGGLGFALIWIPAASIERTNWRAWSWGTVAATVAVGIGMLLLSEHLPQMVSAGEFAGAAIVGKSVAGLLFLVGAAGWLLDYRRLGRSESYLFVCLALLFGVAELMFASSTIWNSTWWFWHMLRLMAYALVLGFLARGYVHVVADLRSALDQSRRSERRLAAQYATTRVLVESSSLAEASRKLLAGVGESLDWTLGVFWIVDEQEQVLRFLDCWHEPKVAVPEFVRNSRQRTFLSGTGLAGRVWASGEPAWITNVLTDSNFPRAPHAAEAGLHGAFAFPIRVGGRVHGVLEFFSHDIREPDPDLLQMIAEVGTKIGQFIQRKRAEETLRETEAKLLEEARLAEVARLLGDIGHDVKNMLMPLVSGAGLLQGELDECFANLTDQEKGKIKSSRELSTEVIEMIQNSSRRLQDRMREIADSVKGLSTPPTFGPCRVTEVVASVLQTLRFPASQKGVVLRTEGLDALPTIQADENRLFNAFYNLVNNAIPEVPAGGTITVWGRPHPEDNSVVIAVADTGRGMSPEVRESLFTYRVISSKAGGTGLGTKIVKDVVDAHGGRITVESEAEKGTTFYLTLPIEGPAIPTRSRSSSPVR